MAGGERAVLLLVPSPHEPEVVRLVNVDVGSLSPRPNLDDVGHQQAGNDRLRTVQTQIGHALVVRQLADGVKRAADEVRAGLRDGLDDAGYPTKEAIGLRRALQVVGEPLVERGYGNGRKDDAASEERILRREQRLLRRLETVLRRLREDKRGKQERSTERERR